MQGSPIELEKFIEALPFSPSLSFTVSLAAKSPTLTYAWEAFGETIHGEMVPSPKSQLY